MRTRVLDVAAASDRDVASALGFYSLFVLSLGAFVGWSARRVIRGRA